MDLSRIRLVSLATCTLLSVACTQSVVVEDESHPLENRLRAGSPSEAVPYNAEVQSRRLAWALAQVLAQRPAGAVATPRGLMIALTWEGALPDEIAGTRGRLGPERWRDQVLEQGEYSTSDLLLIEQRLYEELLLEFFAERDDGRLDALLGYLDDIIATFIAAGGTDDDPGEEVNQGQGGSLLERFLRWRDEVRLAWVKFFDDLSRIGSGPRHATAKGSALGALSSDDEDAGEDSEASEPADSERDSDIWCPTDDCGVIQVMDMQQPDAVADALFDFYAQGSASWDLAPWAFSPH